MTVPQHLADIYPRIETRIDQNGPVPAYNSELGPCWIWNGARSGKGYGMMRIGVAILYTHRIMYELFVGPIDEGLQIDHLCRVRECCNPSHLDQVTPGENLRRGYEARGRRSTCSNGHALPPYEPGRDRICKPCKRLYDRARYLRLTGRS